MVLRSALAPVLIAIALAMLITGALTGWGWALWATTAVASATLMVSSRP